jgi:hypothetical protein
MQSTAQRLTKRGLPIKEFPQSPGNLTEASQHLYDLIRGHNLVMYPFEDLRLAVSRAVAVETSRGWRIAKEKQSHKIDAVVALAIACHAAVDHGYEQETPVTTPGYYVNGVEIIAPRSFELSQAAVEQPPEPPPPPSGNAELERLSSRSPPLRSAVERIEAERLKRAYVDSIGYSGGRSEPPGAVLGRGRPSWWGK